MYVYIYIYIYIYISRSLLPVLLHDAQHPLPPLLLLEVRGVRVGRDEALLEAGAGQVAGPRAHEEPHEVSLSLSLSLYIYIYMYIYIYIFIDMIQTNDNNYYTYVYIYIYTH